MKKILYYIFLVAAALLVASCVSELNWNEEVSEQDVAGQSLTLTFTCGDMATRADDVVEVNGVVNENLIKRIDYFFFPCDDEGNVDDDAICAYKNYLIPEDDGLNLTYTADKINTGVLNQIFPNGATKAVVFAVANFVDYYGAAVDEPNTTIPDDLTWSELQALEVGESFFKDGGEGFELRWPRVMQPSDSKLFFVMVGKEVVELKHTGSYAVDATVELKRLASKVTVKFTYVDFFLETKNDSNPNNDIVWIPQNEDVETRVYLSNGIEHTTLGGPLSRTLVADSWANCTKPQVHNGTAANGTRDIFEYAYDFMNHITTTDDAGNKIAHYYTYPISMEAGDDNQPYLKLVLPWYGYARTGGTDTNPTYAADPSKQKEVYYKIVLPRETICDPNMIYEFDVNVDIIGSDKEVQITGEQYKVKGWSFDSAIPSNVATGRYISLDIPKDYYDMYSNSVSILFVSSGETEISRLQIYDQVLTGNSPVNRYYINGTPTSYVNPYNANTRDDAGLTLPNWVTIEGSKLVIRHTLHTALDNSINIAPFTFVVTLHLKDETSTRFDRTVTITQYPPIYAQTILTEDWHTVFLNGTQYWQGQTRVGNNNNPTPVPDNSTANYLGTVGQNGGNTARTRTIVSVTTLANMDVSVYTNRGIDPPVIGDPRITLAEKYPVNPAVATQVWASNDLGDASNEYIKDYLYADLAKSNVIAPKFMLASGYGSCAGTKTNWIYNVERCAAYQEDGYPAGRWRLPTEAEIVFVYTLAHDLGLLSNPFYDSSNYWANSGRRITGGNFVAAGTGNYSSRCVYDLWYWGDDPVLTTTTTPSITQWSGFMTSK